MDALNVRNLKKTFNGKNGITDVNMSVRKGVIHALLGNNGAGKTTTMKCIAGMLFKDSGSIEIMGHDFADNDTALKSQIGFSFGTISFPKNLTGRECLRVYGAIRGLGGVELRSQVEELLVKTGITDIADRKVSHYSRGMLQKLDLAYALLGDPELLILDEPTAGLDPSSTEKFRELMKRLAAQGKTIVISDHQLSEVERICSDATIIKDGRTVLQSSIKGLLSEDTSCNKYSVNVSSINGNFINDVRKIGGVVSVDVPADENDTLIIKAKVDSQFIEQIHRIAMSNEIDVLNVEILKKTLEDIFISMVDENTDRKESH